MTWVELILFGENWEFQIRERNHSNCTTPGHWKYRKVVESLPVDWWISSTLASQV